jgi:hypothetical protein
MASTNKNDTEGHPAEQPCLEGRAQGDHCPRADTDRGTCIVTLRFEGEVSPESHHAHLVAGIKLES